MPCPSIESPVPAGEAWADLRPWHALMDTLATGRGVGSYIDDDVDVRSPRGVFVDLLATLHGETQRCRRRWRLSGRGASERSGRLRGDGCLSSPWPRGLENWCRRSKRRISPAVRRGYKSSRTSPDCPGTVRAVPDHVHTVFALSSPLAPTNTQNDRENKKRIYKGIKNKK